MIYEEFQTMNAPGTPLKFSQSQLTISTFNYGATGMWDKEKLEEEREKAVE